MNVHMADDDIAGDDVIKPQASNSPKHSRDLWDKIRVRYESKSFVTLKELASEYGVHPNTLRSRIHSEKWSDKQSALANKVEQRVEKLLVDEVKVYLTNAKKRAERAESLIDSAVSQCATDEQGRPVLDFTQVDQLTRSEIRIFELSARALRIVEAKHMEVTGAIGIFNVTEAIKALRAQPAPDLSPLELERLKDCKIEGEEGPVG